MDRERSQNSAAELHSRSECGTNFRRYGRVRRGKLRKWRTRIPDLSAPMPPVLSNLLHVFGEASTATVHFHDKVRVFHGLPLLVQGLNLRQTIKGSVKNRLPVFSLTTGFTRPCVEPDLRGSSRGSF